MKRRQVLTAAAATTSLVAGCTGTGGGGAGGGTPTETETPGATQTSTPTGGSGSLAQREFPDYQWGLLDQVEPEGTTTIEMTGDLRFRPTVAKVSKGDTVTWKNPSFTHTLVIPALDVDREVAGGKQTSLTVDRTGTFDYVCDIHPPKMLGRLVVTESEGTPETKSGETEASVDRTIVMENTTFQTSKAEVDTGATVEWVNKDGTAHTVTSTQFHDTAKSWSLDKRVSGGQSVTHTFDEAGVYEYYCTIHGKSTMCGAVLVGGVPLEKTLPCASDGDGGGGGYY